MKASLFRDEIRAAYDRDNCIQPFIGDGFSSDAVGAFRVMTIGINAYLSEDDWAGQRPEWFSGWFKDGRHKFDRTVAADAATIANVLTTKSSYFKDLTFRGKENVFHTNAVKVYMHESRGKSSDQVTRQDYEAHVPAWHTELDIMARHGVLPHAVIVFGRPFWEWAWQAFHPRTRPSFAHVKVHEFKNAQGEGHHLANRVEVEGAGGQQQLALLAVRHPAARASSKATADWVLSRPDVRELFGIVAE